MPEKFQISFQGGGARIAALLAAAEALQELEADGKIEVTNIAGTSAGAIVGACLASRHPIDEIRTQLHGDRGAGLIGAFKKPKWFIAGMHVYRGVPFWTDDLLANWFHELFDRLRTEGPPRMKDVAPKRLFVVASNLRTGEPKRYSDDDDLVTSLLDSSGLPFCFRPWKSGGHPVIVDGGLCDNLPIDDLVGRTSSDGRVLAFSFRRTSPGNPSSALGFAMSLVDVAINRSVQVARDRLGADSVYTLNTSLTTFDFKAAKAFLGSSAYVTTKEDVKKWVLRLIEESKPAPKTHTTRDVWRKNKNEELFESMRIVGKIYEAQHAKQKFLLRSLKMVVTCNCLVAAGELGNGSADSVFYELTFAAKDLPVFAHRLSLSSPCDNDLYGQYSVKVYDSQNKSVPFEILPSISPESPGDRAFVIFFIPPLNPDAGDFRLSLQDTGMDLMVGLNNPGGEDCLSAMLTRAWGEVKMVSFGIHVPDTFRPITLKKSNIENVRTVEDGEAYSTFGPPPAGFRTFGVIAANVNDTPYMETVFKS